MESPQRDRDADDHITPADSRRLFCEVCGSEDFAGGNDGFFYCSLCGSQSQDVIAAEADADDVFGGEGGVGAIYSKFHERAKSRPVPPPFNSKLKPPSMKEILHSLVQPATDRSKMESSSNSHVFEEMPLLPQDFGYQGCEDPEKTVVAIRLRYVQGLQVMVQLQCEALVEKFEVCPLICGMAMTIWLKYIAVSEVFGDDWVERMIHQAKLAGVEPSTGGKGLDGATKKNRSNLGKEHPKSYGQKVLSITIHSLRKMIPLYATLAISFLSCHLAREAVLPTDIYKWVSESKLPYLSAFTELEKYLGASNIFPLSSRLMFRPIRIIYASFLEVTAASIAQTIGLRTPSINFYAIALRYLKALSLPVSKILPQACRLYEWSLPSELWLSSCISALPTRVYAMSILIVAVRILFDIHGHGIWERSVFDISNSTSFENKHVGAEDDATIPSTTTESLCSPILELQTKELLQVLDTAYHQMDTMHEYSKDLRSYLKYCGDIIFAGLTSTRDEEVLIESLWNLYDKKEDNDQHAWSQYSELKAKRSRDAESANPSKDSKKVKKQAIRITTKVGSKLSSKAARMAALESMKFDMEDNGFEYLPPRVFIKSSGYLHYSRQNTNGKYIFVAHADYYILLRACAKLAEVDPRILHIGVLKFEKKLDWIEKRIDQSLKVLKSVSLQEGCDSVKERHAIR